MRRRDLSPGFTIESGVLHTAPASVSNTDASTADIRGCEFAAGAGVIPSAEPTPDRECPTQSQHDVAIGCVANSEAAWGNRLLRLTNNNSSPPKFNDGCVAPASAATGGDVGSPAHDWLAVASYCCDRRDTPAANTPQRTVAVAPGIRLLAVDTNATSDHCPTTPNWWNRLSRRWRPWRWR